MFFALGLELKKTQKQKTVIVSIVVQVIFDELAAKCGKDFHGSLCIKLWESHKAWGCYEGDVGEEEMADHVEEAKEDQSET